MDLGKYVTLFLADSREHLHLCNGLLLEWERHPAATEPVAGIFRAVHTIKGMAATLGYVRLADLAHATENLLADVRSGRVPVTPALIDCCFRAVDQLEAGVETAAGGADASLDTGPLLKDIGTLQGKETATGTIPEAEDAIGGQTGEFAVPADDGGRPVRVMIRKDAEMRGARAALVLLKAELLGRVTSVMPPRESWDHPGFSGELTFRIHSAATETAIVQAVREAGEIVDVQVGEGRKGPAATTERRRQVRVDMERLDVLVNQVGELVVARNRLAELVRGQEGTDLEVVSNRIGRLVGQVQDTVMHSRMAPVAEVFDRFPRPIRDLARQLGKQVRLEIVGGEIELDRAMLDGLGDPLLHLLRNSVDHGLETPDVRRGAGKAPEGVLRLHARRERNTVRITVEDDGRGIDREVVLARARREGLLGPDERPDDDELLQIIGRPGFSTRKEVTGVSGRGVGIDVVLTRIRALGGKAEIHSPPGQGTRFDLRLPLTLAIVPALMVVVGDEQFAVPLAYVAETAQCEPDAVCQAEEGATVDYRGRTMPVHALDELAQVTTHRPGARRPMVILEAGERRAALMVDTLLGKLDIVVEPFEAPLGMPRWLHGATILGDGVPVLILDPAALL